MQMAERVCAPVEPSKSICPGCFPGQPLLLLACAALVSLCVTACGSIFVPVTVGPRAAATPAVAITLWHAQTGAARPLLESMLADFGKAYPWITLRSEAKSSDGDLLRQGIAAIALNQPPDLVIATPRTIAELGRRAGLVDTSPLLDDPSLGAKPGEREDFLPGLLDAGRMLEFQDQLVAFPFDERAVVLYVNLDQLSAAKIGGPPRTWEELDQAARSVTHGQVRGWVTTSDAITFCAALFSRGGDLLDETQTLVRFDREPGIESLQLLARLSSEGAAYLVDSPTRARSDFVRERAALWFGNTGDLDAVSDAKFRWAAVNVPQKDPSHPAIIMTGARVALFRTTDNRVRAAWLLTRWLTAPEQTAHWARTTLAVPVRLSAQTVLSGLGTTELTAYLRDGFNPAPVVHPLLSIKDAAKIDQAIAEMWAAVANGTDPGEAMNRAATRASRMLSQAP